MANFDSGVKSYIKGRCIIAAAVKAIAPTQYRDVLAQLKGEVNSESV